MALAGVADVVTSQGVFDEVFRAIVRHYGDNQVATLRINELERALLAVDPSAVVSRGAGPVDDPPGLPHENDEHVVAVALDAGADGLLTFNRCHFPEPLLESVGLGLCVPDRFCEEGLRARHPGWVEAIRLALTFPPRDVTTAAQLGMRIDDLNMPRSAGMLLSATWN